MSKYGKLKKNAENFIIQDIYNNMTPDQYKKGVDYVIETTKKELTEEYTRKLNKVTDEFNAKLKSNMAKVIDTISVELLYEIATQMDYFNLKDETEEEKYIKESIKYRIQEMYTNTMDKIMKYAKMKNENQAYREFKKKKKLIENNFDIKF